MPADRAPLDRFEAAYRRLERLAERLAVVEAPY
jgi:hypothetical protein